MTVLNVSARKLDPEVKYNPFQMDLLSKLSTDLPKPFLTHQNLLKEVKTKKDRKKAVKILVRIALVSLSIMTMADPTFALAQVPTEAIAVNQMMTTQTAEIGATDIITLCKWLLGICMAATFGVAMIMSVLASSLGYLKGRTNEAFKWVADIVKSFTMAMLAPMVIVMIALAAFFLFGSSEFFIKLF